MASSLPTTLNDELASNFGLDGFPGVDFGKGIRDRPGLRPQPPVSGLSHLPGDVPNPAASAEDTLTAAVQLAARANVVDGVVPASLVKEAAPTLDVHLGSEAPGLSQDLVGNPQAPLDIDFANESTAFVIQDTDVGLRDGQGLVHHEWMQAEQDPARLPQLNKDSVSDLEALWGGVTTGHEVRAGALKELLAVAMRRSAQGEAISSIQKKLETMARASWPKVKPAFEAIASEHGLHGRLYLRASAFPGLHRGKHANLLRKLAGRVRYLVGGNDEAAAALGLRRVAHVRDIPWEEELQRVASRLAAQGRTLKAGMNPQEALRQAFLSQAEVRVAPGFFPKGQARPTPEPAMPKPTPKIDRVLAAKWARVGKVADRLVKAGILSPERLAELHKVATPEEFRRSLVAEATKPKQVAKFQGPVLKAAPVQEPKKQASVPVEALVAARTQHQAQRRVEQFVEKLARQGAISAEQVPTLSKLASIPEVRAAVLNQKPRQVSNYSGGWSLDPLKRQAAEESRRLAAEQERVQELTRKQAQDRLRAKVERLKKGAVRGEDVQALIPRLFSELEKKAAQKAIDLILRQAAAPKLQVQATHYTGKVYTAHQSSAKSSYNDTTLASAQRWVLQQLHRGSDQFLDQELSRRYASVAGDPSLVQIRRKHAGKAGSLYIDASAFASPIGIAGCEKAAQTFRLAPAKYVIAMDRCHGCAFRNAHGDCRKYRRPLVASVEEIPQ